MQSSVFVLAIIAFIIVGTFMIVASIMMLGCALVTLVESINDYLKRRNRK